MTLTNDYRYDLRINGADETTLLQFAKAFEETRLIDYMGQAPNDPALFSTEAVYGSGGLYEETIENELHALATQFPALELHFKAEDLDDRGHGYELKFHGDLYRRANLYSVLSEFCPPTPFHSRKEALLAESERDRRIQDQIKTLTQDTDFDLLFAQKQAILNHLETDESIPKEALEGIVSLLNNLVNLGESVGRFQYDGRDPAFPLQQDYKKTAYSFPSEQEKIHIFCEELEGDDGIRTFTVLGVSRDKDALKALLQAKVEKDEYGLIESNGINDDFETLFSSQFNDGFVSYYILEEDVLTREQTLSKLNTREYDPSYEYPSDLDKVLNPILKDILDQGIYSEYDLQKAAEHIKGDKGFQTIFKTKWWGSPEYFSIEAESKRSSVTYSLRSFINEQLRNNPNYFTDVGAAIPFTYPANIKDLLVNAIYDISKDYHLPVQDAGREADLIMRDSIFRNLFRNHGPDALEFGTEGYENALWACQKFVRSHRIPEPEPELRSAVPKLDERVSEALQRQSKQAGIREPERKGNDR